MKEKCGVGFVGLLQLMFIVLKLCNVINWSWGCVLLPAIISVGILFLAICVIFILAIVKSSTD